MTNDIEKVKAYAKELEDILHAVELDVVKRTLVNYCIAQAKRKFDMYD